MFFFKTLRGFMPIFPNFKGFIVLLPSINNETIILKFSNYENAPRTIIRILSLENFIRPP